MKTIAIITASHPLYDSVYAFANAVYQDTLGAPARTPPETFVVVHEHETILGCIGISETVSSDLFINDTRYQRFVSQQPADRRIGEQNIFAVRGFRAGILPLMATTVAYAEMIGLHKIAFAGIGMSCRAVQQLGFSVTVLGQTKATVFSKAERQKYTYWLEHFSPLSCLLDTAGARDIQRSVANRFASKVQPVEFGSRLAA